MPKEVSPEQFSEFEIGVLYAAAFLAGYGEDVRAEELAATIGVYGPKDICGRGLERHDGNQLRKLFRRIR